MFEIIFDDELVIFAGYEFPSKTVEGRHSIVSPSNIFWSSYFDREGFFTTFDLNRINGEMIFKNYLGSVLKNLVIEYHSICEKTTKEDFAKSIKQKF